MAYLDDLNTNIAALNAAILEATNDLTAFTSSTPLANYSLDGESVSFGDYLNFLKDKLNNLLNALRLMVELKNQIPYEIQSRQII